ncbi:MAG: HAD family hydrolase [Acidimicrobiia bacterium]|nr:HAD family hydrolase [Acidimicrobiia bacterium]
MTIEVVALDGDDTLWHSEVAFKAVQERFADLVAAHVDVDAIADELLSVERTNLERFGYGVKSFTISMIETAISITDGAVTAGEVHEIIELGKWLLDHPIELLADVADTVPALAERYHLLLITKGDLLHQETKVAASGLADHFDGVHIVSEKNTATYGAVIDQLGVDPAVFAMAGNSLPSDVLPVIEVGGHGVHIPHDLEWEVEQTAEAVEVPTVERLGELPDLLAEL